MKKEDVMDQRHKVLERIQNEMQEGLIAATIITADEEEGPEVLNVVLDGIGFGGEEAIGEFCFLPLLSDDTEVQYFSSVITIADELDEDCPETLYEAMSYINFQMASGSFCIDRDHSFLVYKLTVPVSVSVTDEALYEQVSMYMGTATAMADKYMDLLLRILDKELTLNDVIISLG